ncbi:MULTISPECIES: S-layer homology domain-containing protein [Lysinibacillus]|uniref:CAP and S-layer homology domain-containing protein n=1 Tax=Lysinibacillus TaxID=400634 RepID=UPI00257FC01E|nr:MULTISPECIES: S-layer homology domain-containing protein [Lysinibacillus]
MFKKISSVVGISLTLLVTSYAVPLTITSEEAVAASIAKDVSQSHWASSSIAHMLDKHYMTNDQNGYFRPEQPITRAEAAAAIARSMQLKFESSFSPDFTDLSDNHPYYKEICALVERGILQNGDCFYPDTPLKRMHITKMLTLAYKIEVDSENISKFNDVTEGHWAKDYIESLADVGVIKGINGQQFGPNQLVTRAQFASLVERSLDFSSKVTNYEIAYDYLSKSYMSTKNYSSSMSNDVIQLINNERQKKKLQPLSFDAALTQIAVIKAQDMVNRHYFEHESPYYGMPWDLATLFDYSYTSLGENIGRNIPSPEAAVKAWMASPAHRDNILRENYTNTGVAIAIDSKGNYYWVQLFSSQ